MSTEPAHVRLGRHLERLTGPSEALGGRVALRRLCALDEGVWAVESAVPYSALARALSLVEGGMWMASATGLTWVNGRQCCWLAEWRGVEEIKQARETVTALGVGVRSWTLGGVARALLKWTGITERHFACNRPWLSDTGWAYRLVEPGEYQEACLCDLASAYHQVVERLPSPRVVWLDDGPVWSPLTGAEAERWTVVTQAAKRNKGLRTRLLGCMIGGGTGVLTYHKGQRLQCRVAAGPLVTAGLLVARTVYELTALEAHNSHAVYANTDAVVTQAGVNRAVWERYGYAYRVEAAGKADLVALGCYRVGDRQTAWYGAGGRFPVAYPADPVPDRLTLPYWH